MSDKIITAIAFLIPLGMWIPFWIAGFLHDKDGR